MIQKEKRLRRKDKYSERGLTYDTYTAELHYYNCRNEVYE